MCLVEVEKLARGRCKSFVIFSIVCFFAEAFRCNGVLHNYYMFYTCGWYTFNIHIFADLCKFVLLCVNWVSVKIL